MERSKRSKVRFRCQLGRLIVTDYIWSWEEAVVIAQGLRDKGEGATVHAYYVNAGYTYAVRTMDRSIGEDEGTTLYRMFINAFNQKWKRTHRRMRSWY